MDSHRRGIEDFDSLSLSTDFSRSTGDLTPAESDIDFQGEDDRGKWAAKRWEEALRRCRKTLDQNKSDNKVIEQIDSEDKFFEGVEGLLNNMKSHRGVNLVHYLVSSREPLHNIIKTFILIMIPRSVTIGIFWGITYLVVQYVVRRKDDTTEKYAEMINQIRRQLAQLSPSVTNLEDGSEVDEAERNELRVGYVDVLEALIYFWKDSVGYLRTEAHQSKNIPGASVEKTQWKSIEESFRKTMAKIGGTNEHLRKYQNARFASRSQQRNRDTTRAKDDGSKVFPVHLIPDRLTRVFIGRDKTLSDMTQHLHDGFQSRTDMALYTLCGIGGVGKTELARAYAHRHRHELDAIFWVNAEKQQFISEAFSRFAVELKLEDAKIDGNPANNHVLVRHWMRTTGRKWLLILDNVDRYEDVESYLPIESPGSVIVTTRYPFQAQKFGQRKTIVKKLEEDQARALFLELLFNNQDGMSPVERSDIPVLPEEEEVALQFLLAELDGLVLGIQQMAALIKNGRPSLTHQLAKFVRRYKLNMRGMITKDAEMKGRHQLTTLWAMTFDTLRTDEEHPHAWTMLGILCCLQPDEIPRNLFLNLDPSLVTNGLSFCNDDGFDVDDGIEILTKLGLVELSDESRDISISLHRLTQIAFLVQKDIDASERQDLFNSASILVNESFPKQIQGRGMHERWGTCQVYIKHGSALADLFTKMKMAKLKLKCTTAFAELMTNCAWYLSESGSWQETLKLIQTAIEACQEVEKDGLTRAHLLNTEFGIHFQLNRFDRAREPLEECLRIREKVLDPWDEELANVYLNIGNLETAEKKYDEALTWFDKSTEIRKKLLPEGKQMLGVCQLNHARAFLLQGNFEAASSLLKDTERIFREEESKQAHSIMFVHYFRGNLYLAQGQLQNAGACYKACLEGLLKILPASPKIAASQYKIGTIGYRLGNYNEALKSLKDGLAFARKRGENGVGEQARILRRQAQVLEADILESGPNPELLELVKEAYTGIFRGSVSLPSGDIVAEALRAEADRLRIKSEGDEHSLEDDEETAFNDLVVIWDR